MASFYSLGKSRMNPLGGCCRLVISTSLYYSNNSKQKCKEDESLGRRFYYISIVFKFCVIDNNTLCKVGAMCNEK